LKQITACLLLALLLCSTSCTRAVLWDKYYDEGKAELAKKNYPEAENLLTLAVKQAEHFGPQDPRRVDTYYALAQAYLGEKRYKEAVDTYSAALEVQERSGGPFTIEKSDTIDGVAKVFEDEKRFREALIFRKYSLAMAQEKLGPNNARTIEIARKYIQGQMATGDYKGAADISKRVLTLQEGLSGTNDKSLVPTLKLYGEALRNTGKATESAAVAARIKKLEALPDRPVGGENEVPRAKKKHHRSTK
jgi:tetratricopeptide (TPR) repeat protein